MNRSATPDCHDMVPCSMACRTPSSSLPERKILECSSNQSMYAVVQSFVSPHWCVWGRMSQDGRSSAKATASSQRTSAEGEDSSGAASQGERPKPQEMQNFRFGLLLVFAVRTDDGAALFGTGNGRVVWIHNCRRLLILTLRFLRPVVDSFYILVRLDLFQEVQNLLAILIFLC